MTFVFVSMQYMTVSCFMQPRGRYVCKEEIPTWRVVWKFSQGVSGGSWVMKDGERKKQVSRASNLDLAVCR